MKPIILLLLTIICFSACKKDKATNPLTGVEFTITRSGGLIGITDYYRLSNGKLYGTDSTQALPAAKYAIAGNLAAALPQYFFTHPDTSWGCTLCGDAPSLYITWKKDSGSYYWAVVLTDTDLLPSAVAAYSAQANAALDSLK